MGQTVARIEVWHDTVSDPANPVWCVSACSAAGDEIDCIDTADAHEAALDSGRKEAADRLLPLCERGTDGSLTTLADDPRPAMEELCEAIVDESERQVIARLGYNPGRNGWYYGGESHNDYRLRAEISDGRVMVSDGNASEPYTGDPSAEDIASYVEDWLDMTMPASSA